MILTIEGTDLQIEWLPIERFPATLLQKDEHHGIEAFKTMEECLEYVLDGWFDVCEDCGIHQPRVATGEPYMPYMWHGQRLCRDCFEDRKSCK